MSTKCSSREKGQQGNEVPVNQEAQHVAGPYKMHHPA